MRARAANIVVCLCAVCVVVESRTATAQIPPQQTAPALAPVDTPVPLGVGGHLASWLQVRGEFRNRIEGFTGGGFGSDDDAYWMDRFRLSATVRPTQSLTFLVQAQDSRAFDKTSGSQVAPFRDRLDVRQAFGEFAVSRVAVRVGRQDLAFGEQRLIGNLPWTNTARSFDGARATLKGALGQLDVFGASVVTIDPTGFDRSGKGNALYGAYGAVTALVPKQIIEPYFFWRQSLGLAAELGGTATLRQATTGIRMVGTLPSKVDYSSEVAVQTGSVGSDEVRAWAGHGLVGKALADAPSQPRLFVEYNFASGDANQTDGTRGTFDQLYPTGHDKLGLADQVGWRNIHHARFGLEVKPARKWQMTGSYHSWWLATVADGLYGASGALLARSLAGTAGRHVGQEIDVQATYAYSPQLQINGGFAHVLPGEFLKNTTPGRSYNYPYVMVTYVFLGEKPSIVGRKAQ